MFWPVNSISLFSIWICLFLAAHSFYCLLLLCFVSKSMSQCHCQWGVNLNLILIHISFTGRTSKFYKKASKTAMSLTVIEKKRSSISNRINKPLEKCLWFQDDWSKDGGAEKLWKLLLLFLSWLPCGIILKMNSGSGSGSGFISSNVLHGYSATVCC